MSHPGLQPHQESLQVLMHKHPAMLSCVELMEVRTMQRRKAEWYQRVRLCISNLVTHILKPGAPEIGCFCSQISTLCAQLPMLVEGEVCLNDERIKMSKTGFPLVPNTSRYKGKETFLCSCWFGSFVCRPSCSPGREILQAPLRWFHCHLTENPSKTLDFQRS